MKSYDNVMGVIMGGGQGTRLYPLTKERAKPVFRLPENTD
jgi:ADP-glucose pyrophosphorylase